MQMDVEEKQLCLTVRWGLKSATLKSKKSFLEDIVLPTIFQFPFKTI